MSRSGERRAAPACGGHRQDRIAQALSVVSPDRTTKTWLAAEKGGSCCCCAQNWFAVALDFIIVVAGILIAFQITAWNEQRADRAKEALYLFELIEDLNADLAEFDSIKRTAEIRMGALERILALADIEPRRTLTFDGVTFSFDPPLPFQSNDPFEANIQLTNTPDLDGSRETLRAE